MVHAAELVKSAEVNVGKPRVGLNTHRECQNSIWLTRQRQTQFTFDVVIWITKRTNPRKRIELTQEMTVYCKRHGKAIQARWTTTDSSTENLKKFSIRNEKYARPFGSREPLSLKRDFRRTPHRHYCGQRAFPNDFGTTRIRRQTTIKPLRRTNGNSTNVRQIHRKSNQRDLMKSHHLLIVLEGVPRETWRRLSC